MSALRFKDEQGKDYPDWEEINLGKLCKIVTGKLDVNAMVEGGQYRFYTCAREHFWIDKFAFDTEALLISGNGANVGYIHYYSGKFNAYQRTYVLDRFEENIFYIKYFLEQHLRKRINHEKKEGNTPYIVLNTLAGMSLTIPHKNEQQKIAAFLSSVDTKIEQLNKKKSLLEQYKKGMMQKLFSQEIRFKDEQGEEYPDWEKKQFSHIANKVSDSYCPVDNKESFECIELESLSSESGQVLKTFNSHEQKSIKTKFARGDVLFGKLRPYLKKYYRAQFDGVCTSEIWVLRPKSVPSKFLYSVIQTNFFNRIANIQSGSKMPRSDWNIVSESVFLIPFSHDEQQKIASFLSAIEKKIELVTEQIKQAQTFKKGLLQQMFI